MAFLVKYSDEQVKRFSSLKEISNPQEVHYIDCSKCCLTFFEEGSVGLTNEDMNELENFTNLKYLDCSYNNITELKLPSTLTTLYCNSNFGINLNQLPENLEKLSCMNCGLKSLPKLSSKVVVNCKYNYITEN